MLLGPAISPEDARRLPPWRRPLALLLLMAFAMPISFATWSALLNNFVIDRAGFTGVEIGWLHSVREIPGFLAVGVIAVLLVMHEQVLALLSLALLGMATAVTAEFPSFSGLLVVTLLSSLGFHYYETVNQSLQLQWLDRREAPRAIGWIVSAGSAAALLAYGVLVVGWKAFDLDYGTVYRTAGGVTLALTLLAAIVWPRFAAPHPQRRKLLLRRRYWLYYLLQFVAGARRQIFVVFAAFMMVERFGLEVHELTALFLVNFVANMVVGPLVGRAITRFGERTALTVEYAGLFALFLGYAGIYLFDWSVWVAAALYVLDHLLFAMSFALRTYFQKIADPGDIAPTAAVAFTINHVAAVFLPALLGYLWVRSPLAVFLLAAGLAAGSLLLALLIPRHPAAGHETIFRPRLAAAAE